MIAWRRRRSANIKQSRKTGPKGDGCVRLTVYFKKYMVVFFFYIIDFGIEVLGRLCEETTSNVAYNRWKIY